MLIMYNYTRGILCFGIMNGKGRLVTGFIVEEYFLGFFGMVAVFLLVLAACVSVSLATPDYSRTVSYEGEILIRW